jgi:hypothetical protein
LLGEMVGWAQGPGGALCYVRGPERIIIELTEQIG